MRWSLLLAFAVGQLALAQTVEVLRTSGPSADRIDVVVLGDGYRDVDQAKMTSDANTLINALLSFRPYDAFADLMNVKLIHAVSVDNGADNGSFGATRDTRYGAYFNCGGIDRLLCVNIGAVNTDVFTLAPEANITIVMVNDSKYGGSGGSVVVTSTNSLSVDILRHELGHTLAHLADEYTSPYPGYPACAALPADCSEPNVTRQTVRADLKWRPWVLDSTPIPSPSGTAGVGLFLGARYVTSEIYRPVDSACLMKTLGQPFCSVCAEALTLAMGNYVTWVDHPSPATPVTTCSNSPALVFDAPHPPAPTLTFTYHWAFDGTGVDGGQTVVAPTLGVGTHSVALTLQVGTELVRSDPLGRLREQVSWSLSVDACDGGAMVDAGADSGVADAGPDAGTFDAGAADSGQDAGGVDAGGLDAGAADSGQDAGSADAGTLDAGSSEDAGSTADAGSPEDAGVPDAGASNAGQRLPDGGLAATEPIIGGCGCSEVGWGDCTLAAWVAFAWYRRRFRL